MVGRDKPDTIRQCSVYSEKEFGKIQDKIISQYQKKLDYKLSKNKI